MASLECVPHLSFTHIHTHARSCTRTHVCTRTLMHTQTCTHTGTACAQAAFTHIVHTSALSCKHTQRNPQRSRQQSTRQTCLTSIGMTRSVQSRAAAMYLPCTSFVHKQKTQASGKSKKFSHKILSVATSDRVLVKQLVWPRSFHNKLGRDVCSSSRFSSTRMPCGKQRALPR
jgi:hypothetical protein